MKISIIDEIETVAKEKLSNDQSNIVPHLFFSSRLALYTLRKLCPFAPLWSSFWYQRLSNVTIEGHNKVLKYNLDQACPLGQRCPIRGPEANFQSRILT